MTLDEARCAVTTGDLGPTMAWYDTVRRIAAAFEAEIAHWKGSFDCQSENLKTALRRADTLHALAEAARKDRVVAERERNLSYEARELERSDFVKEVKRVEKEQSDNYRGVILNLKKVLASQKEDNAKAHRERQIAERERGQAIEANAICDAEIERLRHGTRKPPFPPAVKALRDAILDAAAGWDNGEQRASLMPHLNALLDLLERELTGRRP